MHFSKKIILSASVFILFAAQVQSQTFTASSKDAESAISEKSLYEDIEFLSDSLCAGRATGTRGGSDAAMYIARRFAGEGLSPVNGGYFQNFTGTNGKTGHNVIGMMRGNIFNGSDKYIIIAAHYDNLGTLGARMFPGADSNASGVAAMLGIASMFRFMRAGNRNYNQHIIFAALDGKQMSMAGAETLWAKIDRGELISPLNGKAITRKNITLFVNLDILGSSEAPLNPGREDYLIMLGGKNHNSLLRTTNQNYNIHLDLAYDYYGSKGFTDMFLNRVSDQKVFLQNGVYSVMFTSGITLRTNKENDLPENLNMEVLKKRTWLIFHWVERVIQIL